jgi:hypothetical protein
MTTTQIHLFNLLYLVVSVVVAILTRATPRRIGSADAGWPWSWSSWRSSGHRGTSGT